MARTPLVFDLRRGDAPLLISVPHDGRLIPKPIAARMTGAGKAIADTDWHVRRLYEVARELDATLVEANYSRYVVDLNRGPDGGALYPGQRETGLCPITTFADEPIYLDGEAPTDEEVGLRVERYWRPYHDALASELARLQRLHPRVLLWDAHSIRSRVPRFFEGALPDFNFGSNNGQTCPDELLQALADRVRAEGYSAVCNGRFKGGHITRKYGSGGPQRWAIQLELSQATYMDESSGRWRNAAAQRTGAVIKALLETALSAVVE